MEFVIPLLIGGAVLLTIKLGPALLARRRRAALSRGGEAVFRVRLAGRHAPYPQTPRRGVLRIGADSMIWSARRGGVQLDLTRTGVRPGGLRSPQPGDRAGQHDLVLTAADGVGTPLRLVGLEGTVEDLRELLQARALPPTPTQPTVLREGRQRLALGVPALLVLLGILGGAFTAWTLSSGVRVTGTVITDVDADGYCNVRWTDPRDGSTQVNGVECYDDLGDDVNMIALAEPLRGEVVASDDPWFWAVLSAAIGLGGVGLALWRRRERRLDQLAPAASGDARAPPVQLTADQLSYDDVVVAMRVRARAEGWSFDQDASAAEPQPWTLRSPRRLLLTAVAASVWPLLIGTFFALIAGWTSLAGVWATTGPTATVTAEVTDAPYETVPFAPADLEVTFPVRDGGTETTLVAVRGLPEPTPKTLPIEYSLSDPNRARALQYDGRAVGAGLAGLAFTVGAGFSGWRLWHLIAVRRAERRARTAPGRLRRYVLIPDLDATCVLLIYPDGLQDRPEFALELLDDPRGRIAAAGTVELRGALQPGEVVAALINGRELLTASPLLEVDQDEVLGLVNATDPVDA